MTEPSPAPEPAVKLEQHTLVEPIVRGDTKIEALTIRKPHGPELRGLSLQDIMSTDISTLYLLIPRVSMPPITQDEAYALDPQDLAEIGGIIRGFFMTRAEKAMIEAVIAVHAPKT